LVYNAFCSEETTLDHLFYSTIMRVQPIEYKRQPLLKQETQFYQDIE